MLIANRSSELDLRRVLRPGDVVTWPQGPGEPLALTRRLIAQRDELPHFELFIGMSTSDTLTPENTEGLTIRALNGAGTNRALAALGRLDLVPCHVSAVPEAIRSGAIKVDAVLLRVRPHTRHGYFTVGVMTDFVAAMVSAARVVVAEVDERLPLTADDALLAATDIDVLTECDGSEILLPDPEPSGVERRIAEEVANIVPQRATVQLGIGTLPVAVCQALSSHRELGVHSGVISDALVDLMERGVVTNAHKGIDAGVVVTGGLFGSRRLLDFANRNEAIRMRSADYTHSQIVMGQLRAFHTINSAIEVDLTGQVNSEMAGARYIGAIGGQVDFVRGAQRSRGGRSVIALPSTTPDGRHSRIVASLEGRPVTTGRADVDLVVTEYGVADLRGQALGERAKRLKAIAHPDHRERLEHCGG